MLNLLASARGDNVPTNSAPRLHSAADRTAFRRWFTFLAESRYYAHAPLRGVSDTDGLLSWAYRQALRRHNARWFRSMELPLLPVMPSVCEVGAGVPTSQGDPLRRIFVSRDAADAEPGDLLMYRRAETEARLMIYIGASQVLPSPKKWVIYQTNSPIETHKVTLESLIDDPSPEWRATAENADFLGVWRLDILGEWD
jgi:uncharacterized protein YfaT (DUF1175 family)